MTTQFPSIAEHPLIGTVQRIGVAAHHAGHLPSWKVAVEELMRTGSLDAVFATTTLAAGVDFPARTVVVTQSSIRKARDFTDFTASEIQQLAGRAGRRGKDWWDLPSSLRHPISTDGLDQRTHRAPEPIHSQFVISYPMVLNLLKAHPREQIQSILAKSFAQFQLNQRTAILETQTRRTARRDGTVRTTGLLGLDHTVADFRPGSETKKAPRARSQTRITGCRSAAEFSHTGTGIGLVRGRGIILRQYRSKGQHAPMVTLLREGGALNECPASIVTQVFDRTYECEETSIYPWTTPQPWST